ncbi:MAG: hypothetical protein A2045_05770 [Rhodocyclales bacterium GWA2_65_20]|nr:MAG: hypothetical protein A2045_05770 [Rhodocyclales bacterium GWA2_65_20]
MVTAGKDADLPPLGRAPLLALGFVALVFGVLGGLWRLGWAPPLPGTEPATFHGALMAAAFFGTVIGLERAAAYGRWPAYLGPLCAGVGGVATAWGAPHIFSASLLVGASAVLAAVTFAFHRRQPAPHLLLLLVGALCGVAGNLLWLAGFPASEVMGAWAGFLVLTIVGERLELSRLRRPSAGALKLLAVSTVLYLVGAVALPLHWKTGTAVIGVAMVGLALWLSFNDIARRNLRHHGLMRFTAVCLVGGYAWLGLGGLLLPFAAPAGPLYDAALHAVFLGFVFAMVFGHAPIIFPAVLRVAVPYTPLFYAHVALLNATLAVRIAGDLLDRVAWRAWGGMGNAVALALFLLMTVGSVIRARRPAAA